MPSILHSCDFYIIQVREPAPGKINKNLKEFFDILDSNPAFVPQPWNPGAIFFLTCLDAFKTAWEEWLCPAILSTGQYPDVRQDNDYLDRSMYTCSDTDRYHTHRQEIGKLMPFIVPSVIKLVTTGPASSNHSNTIDLPV